MVLVGVDQQRAVVIAVGLTQFRRRSRNLFIDGNERKEGLMTLLVPISHFFENKNYFYLLEPSAPVLFFFFFVSSDSLHFFLKNNLFECVASRSRSSIARSSFSSFDDIRRCFSVCPRSGAGVCE